MPVDPDFRRPALVDRIVRGTMEPDPVRLHGAMAQHQVHWVYWLTDGKISRAASFPRREQAEAAARSGVIPSGARG